MARTFNSYLTESNQSSSISKLLVVVVVVVVDVAVVGVCVCVVITFSRLGINRVWLPILLVVS